MPVWALQVPACTAPPTSVSVAAAADVNPTGIELAVALSASAFAIVLGLAVAPVIHRFLLSRSSSQVRQRRMAQSLDKAAIAVQQRRIAEHGHRNALIDQWLATQDLPRALPALRPLPTSSFAAPAADTFRRETEIKQSIEKEQKRSTEMAMKIGVDETLKREPALNAMGAEISRLHANPLEPVPISSLVVMAEKLHKAVARL